MKFRRYVCAYVYLPTVWEVETRILGRIHGVGQKVLKEELEAHRRAWDPELRDREAQALSEARWSGWRRSTTGRASHAGSQTGRRPRATAIFTPQGQAIALNKRA